MKRCRKGGKKKKKWLFITFTSEESTLPRLHSLCGKSCDSQDTLSGDKSVLVLLRSPKSAGSLEKSELGRVLRRGEEHEQLGWIGMDWNRLE